MKVMQSCLALMSVFFGTIFNIIAAFYINEPVLWFALIVYIPLSFMSMMALGEVQRESLQDMHDKMHEKDLLQAVKKN